MPRVSSPVRTSASSSSVTLKATSFDEPEGPRRLVWCCDATGRDGELVQRLLDEKPTPKNEAGRQNYLALRELARPELLPLVVLTSATSLPADEYLEAVYIGPARAIATGMQVLCRRRHR
jgi:hypothetical protein